MKIMTCRELGGPCNQDLSAQTWDEMVFGVIRFRSTKADADAKGPDTQLPDFAEIFGSEPPPGLRERAAGGAER